MTSFSIWHHVATDLGAAYGTAKSGVGISSMGVMNPQLVMRNIIPVVMAGVLGIYGLIVAVILIQNGMQLLSLRCEVPFAHVVCSLTVQLLATTLLSTVTRIWLLVCLAVCPVLLPVWPSASSVTLVYEQTVNNRNSSSA